MPAGSRRYVRGCGFQPQIPTSHVGRRWSALAGVVKRRPYDRVRKIRALPSGWSTVELFYDEHNVTWCGHEPRMKNIKGAVWDAIALVSRVSSGTSFSYKRVSPSGYTTGSTTYGTLTSSGGFSLPTDSVTVFSKNGH